ncbi:MAG: nucleotidyltransferase [bacterium]
MPNLNPLIRDIEMALRPDPERVKLARSRMESLVARIDKGADRFDVRAIRPHGSLARGTAIRGFPDIDCLIVLDAQSRGIRRGDDPKNTIHELRRWIEARHRGLVTLGHIVPRSQTHSVGVEYPGQGLRVDLVPALVRPGRGGHIYRIPSREKQRWIHSNIGRFEALAKEASPKTRAAIRLIKGWRRARGDNSGFSLPSYAIELMLLTAPRPANATAWLTVVRAFFERIADAHMQRRLVLDANDTGDPVSFSEPWTKENLLSGNDGAGRRALIEKCRWTVDRLDAAAAAATARGASTILRSVFIPPEYR